MTTEQDEYSTISQTKLVLLETSAFIGLFNFLQFPTCDEDIIDHSRFASIAKLVAFYKFQNAAEATDYCSNIFHAKIPLTLQRFFEDNLALISDKIILCQDPRLPKEIKEKFDIKASTCEENALYIRGLRIHAKSLVKSFVTPEVIEKSELAIAHGFSRREMSMNSDSSSDNMIIQSSTILEQTEKNANNFYMKIKEWYGYHFPELSQIVTDPVEYIACVREIQDKKNLEKEEVINRLKVLFENKPHVVEEICQKSKYSVGIDINDEDLHIISKLTYNANKMQLYRVKLKQYVSDKLSVCCPNLQCIVGDHVAANFLTKAGSLLKLSKLPASTIQILGAEKALFKAIKSRGKTPKYGFIFNSSYITKASTKNKGKIARALSNKCAIAIRFDQFHQCRKPLFGEAMKNRLEEYATQIDKNVKESVQEIVDKNRKAIESANSEILKLTAELKKCNEAVENENRALDIKKKNKVIKKKSRSKNKTAVV